LLVIVHFVRGIKAGIEEDTEFVQKLRLQKSGLRAREREKVGLEVLNGKSYQEESSARQVFHFNPISPYFSTLRLLLI
jgi:hypothetical protein